MAANALYPVGRTDQVLTEQVGDELVVYDELAQNAHCLSPEAASVWRCCDGTKSEAELAEHLGLSPHMVSQALAELDEAGLLVSSAGGSSLLTGISRRQVLKGAAGTALAAPLLYSVAVPAAALACSKYACSVNPAVQAYTDFNQVAAGDWLWINVTASGIPTTVGATIGATGVTVALQPQGGGATFATVNLPDSVITIGASNSAITHSYVSSAPGHPNGLWTISVPSGTGTVLLTGGALQLPTGSGNTHESIISGTFTSSLQTSFKWQYGLAAYTQFTSDYNNLGLLIATGDIGDPVNYNAYLDSGGSGGGGANYTGSNSYTDTCQTACI